MSDANQKNDAKPARKGASTARAPEISDANPKSDAKPARKGASAAAAAPEALQPPPLIPPILVFSLAALVILAALGAVIYWVFGTTSQLQYPMIVALLCFALSTVACLLFASQAKLNATLPIASITMGGPAVIWIGTLILFAYLFPVPPVSQQSVVDILRMQQIREGWRPFPDWVKQLGELGKEVLQNESSHVRHTLDVLYYTGIGRQKISSPIIDHLYVYPDDKTALEFTRLRGAKSDIAEIYFKAHPTESGTATSMLLAKSRDAIVVAEMSGQSDWTEVRSENLDCLIVTIYDEGLLQRGDFVYFGTNKYRKDGNAAYRFGVMTSDPIQSPKGWRFRGFPFPLTDEIPVVFRRHGAPWATNVDPLIEQLSEWFALLDRKPLDSGRVPEAAAFLEQVRGRLPGGNFSGFHKAPIFKSAYSARFEDLQDAMAITFERQGR
jgi:hypothetical protein